MTSSIVLYAFVIGLIGLAGVALTFFGVKKLPEGSAIMQGLAAQIHEGAMAFLRREYLVLLPFLAVVAVLLGAAIGTKTAVAYILGVSVRLPADGLVCRERRRRMFGRQRRHEARDKLRPSGLHFPADPSWALRSPRSGSPGSRWSS